MKAFDLSLYLVLDPDLCQQHSMIETAREAVAGGATIVQLRTCAASFTPKSPEFGGSRLLFFWDGRATGFSRTRSSSV